MKILPLIAESGQLLVIELVIQFQRMNESQKFLLLQNLLAENQPLKNLLSLIRSIVAKYQGFEGLEFLNSPHYQFLKHQMNKIRIPQLNNLIGQLREPNVIIALPIKMQPKFTLFFVLVPNGQMFDWHSHPKMSGISKCIHGELQITTLDSNLLVQTHGNVFSYPLANLRREKLNFSSQQTISVIQPHNLNIHKIEARGFSAFFDLLMPDYPENTCRFFRNHGISQTYIFLDELQEPQEVIKGWDIYINQLAMSEKPIIKTFILQ